MNVATILLVVLWVYEAIYFVFLLKDVLAHKNEIDNKKLPHNIIISLVANFFDTLGIGSFAIATSAWKFTKSNKDELIPGSLNVCFAIPTCVEATIFIKEVKADSLTLILMIAASVVGAALGAKIVSKLDITKIRAAMGIALIVVVIITLCKINSFGPFGIVGTASGLTGMKLLIGIVANFIFGILMNVGIGLYAPCMALVLLLGMSAKMAFPIMMGSCAYLMPASGVEFIKSGKYHRGAAIPMIISGSVGALIAGLIVTNLPITALTYMVCVVMIICACMFFHDARKAKK